ncbi:MAG: dTMP kinase [Pirellulales bacterium]
MGLFITLDGVDGGGKSTQVKMLCEYLTARGKTVRTFRDPGSTQLGEALREILLHRQEIELSPTSEMLLYMASRAQLIAEQLRPALAECDYVITDRYLLANVVYQSVGGRVAADAIWKVGEVAVGGLYPDLTVVLDLPIDIALQRMNRSLDRLESRGRDYLDAVRSGFLEQSKQLPGACLAVDASRSIDDVHREITAAVDRLSA